MNKIQKFIQILINSYNCNPTKQRQMLKPCEGDLRKIMIKAENLSISIKEKSILKNSNFQFTQNDKILLAGDSGCGKSVLLSTLLGFYPFDSGKIVIDNLELTPQNRSTIRNNISYFAQTPHLPSGKLKDVIETIFSSKINKNCDFSWEKFNEILKLVHLKGEVLESSFDQLSGGEKQRVFFAVTILLKRKIIIMDEPTSALDSELKKIVIDYLEKVDSTIIVVSHDQEWYQSNTFKIKELEWVQKR